ncbi:hypothetical protein ACFX13_002021 [Malus domestica]
MKDIELEPIVKFHASLMGAYWEQRNMENIDAAAANVLIVSALGDYWEYKLTDYCCRVISPQRLKPEGAEPGEKIEDLSKPGSDLFESNFKELQKWVEVKSSKYGTLSLKVERYVNLVIHS